MTNTSPQTISKYFLRNDKLKPQVGLNRNLGGVWVNLKWKEEHQCGAEGYMRADNRFQNIRWPKRYFLRAILFLLPLSEGCGTRLTIRNKNQRNTDWKTSWLVYARAVLKSTFTGSWGQSSYCEWALGLPMYLHVDKGSLLRNWSISFFSPLICLHPSNKY